MSRRTHTAVETDEAAARPAAVVCRSHDGALEDLIEG